MGGTEAEMLLFLKILQFNDSCSLLETTIKYKITDRITYNVLKDFISVRKSSEELPLDKSDILL